MTLFLCFIFSSSSHSSSSNSSSSSFLRLIRLLLHLLSCLLFSSVSRSFRYYAVLRGDAPLTEFLLRSWRTDAAVRGPLAALRAYATARGFIHVDAHLATHERRMVGVNPTLAMMMAKTAPAPVAPTLAAACELLPILTAAETAVTAAHDELPVVLGSFPIVSMSTATDSHAHVSSVDVWIYDDDD
jgi:hypothetical protein